MFNFHLILTLSIHMVSFKIPSALLRPGIMNTILQVLLLKQTAHWFVSRRCNHVV